MKSISTSYLQKKNKNSSKIKFEEFPGDKKIKLEKLNISKKRKNKVFIFIIIALILTIAIISAYMNLYIIESKNEKYKKVVNVNGDYAIIDEKSRNTTFKDIGFDDDFIIHEVTENGKTYVINEAYNEVDPKLDELESIIVTYDDSSKVNKIELKLIFKNDDLSIDNIYNNSSTVISNFTNIELRKELMNRLLNGSKIIKSDNVIYEIIKLNNNYTMISISIEK